MIMMIVCYAHSTIYILQDMGTGLPFRPATFDACISISALQWLCYSNAKNQNPKRRLTRFFSSLYTVGESENLHVESGLESFLGSFHDYEVTQRFRSLLLNNLVRQQCYP